MRVVLHSKQRGLCMALTKKGMERKQYIQEKAALVFKRRGFTVVTMKDIVEECKMSRGGLYKYYSSTKEIFVDILSFDKQGDYSIFINGMENNKNAIEIIENFLRIQKDELENIENSIRVAVYEFFLSNTNYSSDAILEKYYIESLYILSQTLKYGIERKDITKLQLNEVEKYANHIMALLEGLNILVISKRLPPNQIYKQLDLIISSLN